MGDCQSKPKQPPPAADTASTTNAAPDPSIQTKHLDNTLKAEQKTESSKIKMLLLGAGESGKSTIFKQMRLLYGSPRSDDELRMYGVVARSNTVVAMRKLITLLRDCNLEESLDRESKQEGKMTYRQAYDELVAYMVDMKVEATQDEENVLEGDWCGMNLRAGKATNADAVLLVKHAECMRLLWESETMKTVWSKRSVMNVIDSHQHYLDSIPRLASKTYKPTSYDIIISRLRTTQAITEKYTIEGVDFEVIDVGGQRSERRKWIDCFENVTAVIFVAALSEYDQHLTEARRMNRMVEALELFRSVGNGPTFKNTSILLFLNKKDVFAEKIMHSDISDQKPFSDYSGPKKDYDEGVKYFKQKFKDCLMGNSDHFNDTFIHTTCATDTTNMQFVLERTRAILAAENLKNSGFAWAD